MKTTILFLAVLLVSLAGRPVGAETLDRIVAIVNDEAILLSELKRARLDYEQDSLLAGTSEVLDDRQLLQRMIDDKIAGQEGERLKIEVAQQEVDAAIDDVLRQYGIDEDALKARLAEQGVTYADYRKKIEEQIRRLKLTNRTVRSKVIVDQSKMKAYYSENRESFREPPRLHLRQFVFQGPQAVSQANRVYRMGAIEIERIEAVTADAEAKLIDLGELRSEVLNPRFASMVKDLEPGELAVPFESELGVQMLYLQNRLPSRIRSFDEVRSEVEEILGREETEKQFRKWLTELREKSIIKIKL